MTLGAPQRRFVETCGNALDRGNGKTALPCIKGLPRNKPSTRPTREPRTRACADAPIDSPPSHPGRFECEINSATRQHPDRPEGLVSDVMRERIAGAKHLFLIQRKRLRRPRRLDAPRRRSPGLRTQIELLTCKIPRDPSQCAHGAIRDSRATDPT